jgi:hypothetical protein
MPRQLAYPPRPTQAINRDDAAFPPLREQPKLGACFADNTQRLLASNGAPHITNGILPLFPGISKFRLGVFRGAHA